VLAALHKKEIMLNRENIVEILRERYPYLVSEYGVRRIGSYAKEKQTEDSDIDIVAEFERPIGLRFVEFAEYLEKILGKKTDVLTPEGVKGIAVKKVAGILKKV
jgi:predicted nucleotidyltransferase